MFDKLDKIITSSQEFKMLESELFEGKLSKTIMLISKDGDYSFEFAKLLSCRIFDESDESLTGENVVKVKAGSHPDLKIYPLKERLLVADSEEIVDESSIKPIFASKKVFIIRNIEKSMEGAQNKLLKTLEEPQNNVYFIVTCSNINQVLPTIRSRCAKIELGRLSDDKIKIYLGDCENLQLISVLSEGFIGKAEGLQNYPHLRPLFESVLSCVTTLKSSREVLIYSNRLLEFSEQFNLIIECFSLIFEDILFIKSGKIEKVRFKEKIDVLTSVIDDYTIKAIIEIRKLIDKAVKEMTYNCNIVVVIENLLLNILEVKYICR